MGRMSGENIVTQVGMDPGPDKYFSGKSLLVARLAKDIMKMGPLAEGTDRWVWAYVDGVWVANDDVIRDRAVKLLDDRFTAAHLTNVTHVVKARSPKMKCDPTEEIINFRNGHYLWRADLLRDADPAAMSTVQMTVDWNPDAVCPEFDKFLTDVLLAEDDEWSSVEEKVKTIAMAWELIGYMLMSGNPLHVAGMFTGGGRNGKGTLLRVIAALIGDNLTSVSLAELSDDRFATADLYGTLANICGDIDPTYIEKTAMFKKVTGKDPVRGQRKFKASFTFTAWAVPLFSANKIPGSADVTSGYIDRWVVMAFPNNYTGREARDLDKRLTTKSELEGVAAKAMPALRRLMKRGNFDLSAAGVAAKEDFVRALDPVRTWLGDCCDLNVKHPRVKRTELHRVYKNWVRRDMPASKPLKAAEFYARLEAAGVHKATYSGERGFTGIKVIDDAYDPFERR
jgi:P4 family phage/plasmid primase-like protien